MYIYACVSSVFMLSSNSSIYIFTSSFNSIGDNETTRHADSFKWLKHNKHIHTYIDMFTNGANNNLNLHIIVIA